MSPKGLMYAYWAQLNIYLGFIRTWIRGSITFEINIRQSFQFMPRCFRLTAGEAIGSDANILSWSPHDTINQKIIISVSFLLLLLPVTKYSLLSALEFFLGNFFFGPEGNS